MRDRDNEIGSARVGGLPIFRWVRGAWAGGAVDAAHLHPYRDDLKERFAQTRRGDLRVKSNIVYKMCKHMVYNRLDLN